MEFPIGVFVGLLDAPDHLHDVQGQDALHVHPGGIPHQAHDGVIFPHRQVGLQAHAVEPVDEELYLLRFGIFLEYDNHYGMPPSL